MTLITATRFQNLQQRIEDILGNGAAQRGYGQGSGAGYGSEVSSYPVSNNPSGNLSFIISAADLNAVFADMVRCRIHQIGTQPEEIALLVANLNVAAEDTSFFINNQGSVTNDPDGNKKGIVDFENLMTQIEIDRFLAHPSQMSIESGIISSRNTAWNGTIRHEFTVSFRNADHRRHFFNSGGEIRMSAGLTYTGTEAKTQDWQTMLSNIGTVKFSYNNTLSDGGGASLTIGNYQLTSTYQRIFTKQRTGGVYSANNYFIDAREVDNQQIRFRISFVDDDIGSGPAPGAPLNPISELNKVDENVKGNLESNIRIFRASSNTSVRVPAPTFFNNISLG